MARALDAGRFMAGLQDPPDAPLAPLYVITGSETLLVNECADALRERAARDGHDERISLTLDARSDWGALGAALQTLSLFGTRRLISVSLPSGRPGRSGGQALLALAQSARKQALVDLVVMVLLPQLDGATRKTQWARALLEAATVVDIRPLARERLPDWIAERLARQQQRTDGATLQWMADRVEGNLLAAFQEIQKLALLYPAGSLSAEAVEQAVLNVARYNVFDLRDAMLGGQARRVLNILAGLRAEGEALPLVLWAVGDEVRLLSRLAAARERGTLSAELRQQRVFAQRESLLRQALERVAPEAWPGAVRHAHDIDCLIKGLHPEGRLSDPWQELARLALRIARPARASR